MNRIWVASAHGDRERCLHIEKTHDRSFRGSVQSWGDLSRFHSAVAAEAIGGSDLRFRDLKPRLLISQSTEGVRHNIVNKGLTKQASQQSSLLYAAL